MVVWRRGRRGRHGGGPLHETALEVWRVRDVDILVALVPVGPVVIVVAVGMTIVEVRAPRGAPGAPGTPRGGTPHVTCPRVAGLSPGAGGTVPGLLRIEEHPDDVVADHHAHGQHGAHEGEQGPGRRPRLRGRVLPVAVARQVPARGAVQLLFDLLEVLNGQVY